jgi:protein SCO1/2
MSENRTIIRSFFSFMIMALILLTAAAVIIYQAEKSRRAIPVLGTVPEFAFVERSGSPFGLDDMNGEINVVDFIFTNCHGPCPLMSSVMADLYRFYAPSDRIRFISISVDPLRDSIETLRAYADKFGVSDDRWVFLRAGIDSVLSLYEKGFMLSGDLPGEHSTRFVLVDRNGRIRGYYHPEDDASIELMKTHIRLLAKEQ